MVSYYGGYIKDAITKNTCNLIGEEYENGYKKKGVTPVGKLQSIDFYILICYIITTKRNYLVLNKHDLLCLVHFY